MTAPCEEKPSLVEQFELGRLAAKDIVFPDRFAKFEPLHVHMMRPNTVSVSEEGVVGGADEKAVGDGGAPGDFRQSSQGSSPKRGVGAREHPHHRECGCSHQRLDSTGKPAAGERDTFRLGRHERQRISHRQRVKHREALQASCHQAMHFAANPRAVVDRPWEVLETPTTRCRLHNESRDWPHATWVAAHEAFLERCAAHREECLERLCKRKLDNFEMEVYCQLGHRRSPPDCQHDHH